MTKKNVHRLYDFKGVKAYRFSYVPFKGVKHLAAASAAVEPACPQCNSHNTTAPDGNGDVTCLDCGYVFDQDEQPAAQEK